MLIVLRRQMTQAMTMTIQKMYDIFNTIFISDIPRPLIKLLFFSPHKSGCSTQEETSSSTAIEHGYC